MKIILISISFALLVVIGMFYFVLTNKSTEVSEKAPYSAIINKILITQKEAFIYNVHSDVINFKENILKDDSTDVYGQKLVFKVPTGSKLTFSKAIHYTKSVSGNSYSLLIGKVFIQQLKKEIEVEYQWGKHHTICLEEPCNYWIFPQAVWQKTPYSAKYFYN